ncbi:MAG: TRAP transporter TatT component family protein [Bacteriovoracaceae bacterium]|nr:TRAP transporter TatT component family protein [Bacteriovoracaceae bacterium]
MLKILLAFTFLFNVAHAQNFSDAEAKLMKTEALRLWQKRDDQQSLEEALSKFEHVHSAQPENLEILTYLTRGYFILAELHLTNDDLKKRNLEKARSFGEKGMATNPEYKKLASKDIEEAIKKLTVNEVPVTFWTASSLGKWAKLNGIMASLRYKDQILGMIKQVEKLQPDFYYGAVPRYWGGFYAVAPSIAGGDMKKSKKKFQEAMTVAPEYLGTKNLYAELYLVEKEDKKEFKKQLLEVIASPNGPQEIVPENILEKKKAERLLEQADELF